MTIKGSGSIGAWLTGLTVALVLLFIATPPAHAQTETVLYNFCPDPGCADGHQPYSRLTSDGKGNFYGTTSGAVFELSPNGSGGWNETVLYTFCSEPSCADGGDPGYSNVTFDNVGNLYGTTASGGANGYGVVFELSPAGAGWTETVLYSFTGGMDSAYPTSGVIFDRAGNLYGTTLGGGGGNDGTVFELSPSGGGWTEQVIYNTPSGSNSVGTAGLTMDAAGNIFGVSGYLTGIVFELSPNGSGGWNPNVIHTFTGPPKDGLLPESTLVLDKAGNLYGTTVLGGAHGVPAQSGGTVYELSPGKNGKWTEKILYSFKGLVGGVDQDGREPCAGILFDASGNIYGTTAAGGMYADYGTVFELLAGSHKEKVLWNFNGADGSQPFASLILDGAGNLYGTTYQGGQSGDCPYGQGCGVVFEVNPSGTPTSTTTALTSSPNPSTYGEAVTFTAVVTPAPLDGETVSFMKGKTVLGTGTLGGGSASFTTSALPVGTTTVTAVYGGDGNFDPSTSNKLKQVVKKAIGR